MNKAKRAAVIAGNWKMNMTPAKTTAFMKELAPKVAGLDDCKIVLCVPFVDIAAAVEATKGTNIEIGAENIHMEAKGAYTGEVAVNMLSGVGCQYVILGHSERREYYGETDATLVEKVKLALAEGLSPIFCIGEKKEEREAGRHFEVVTAQVKNVLFELTAEEMAKVVVAYEPVWAIGTGKTATAEQAQEIHAEIRKVLAEKFGALAEEISILYGGSCKPSNAKELFACPDIDGGLIGGAALKAEDFIGIAVSF